MERAIRRLKEKPRHLRTDNMLVWHMSSGSAVYPKAIIEMAPTFGLAIAATAFPVL